MKRATKISAIILSAMLVFSAFAVITPVNVNAASLSNHSVNVLALKAKKCSHKNVKHYYKKYDNSMHLHGVKCKDCGKVIKNKTELHTYGKTQSKAIKGTKKIKCTRKCTKCGHTQTWTKG